MTEFTKSELIRCAELLPQTDPRTSEYHVLLRSIEYLDAMGATIDEIAELTTADMVCDGLCDGVEMARAAAALKAKLGRAKTERAEENSANKGRVVELKPVPKAEIEKPEPAEKSEDLVLEPQPEPITDPAPAPQAVEPPAKTYTSAEVRRALVDARNAGTDVRALMAEFGAESFGGVPASRYADLMKRLGVV